jgi:methylmalonyl-CoA/ethylmalonyl-CoA epimerase
MRNMASAPDQGAIRQIAFVVKDLDMAVENYWHTAGVGPWSIYTTGAPPLRCIYHGQPASYKIKLAIAITGPVQMELIEYISGDTIHRDFLASGGKGIEHVGIFVPDLDEALQPYLSRGVGILQQAEGLGVKRDGRYAYLDTESILGTILELIQSSSQPLPPERIYPEKSTIQKGDIK